MGNIKELRYWTYKILPLVYDDSLSYLEVLSKVKYKLNEVIKTTNELPDAISAGIEKQLQGDGDVYKNLFNGILTAIATNENKGTYTPNVKQGGEVIWLDGRLYEVVQPMAVGVNYVEGTNIVPVDIDSMFNHVIDTISAHNEYWHERATGKHDTSTYMWWKGQLYRVDDDIAVDDIISERTTVDGTTSGQLTAVNVMDEVTAHYLEMHEADNNLQTQIDENDGDIADLRNEDAYLQQQITANNSSITDRVDNIVSQAGNDNTEIVDARKGAEVTGDNSYNTLRNSINSQVTMIEEPKINAYNELHAGNNDENDFSISDKQGNVIASKNYSDERIIENIKKKVSQSNIKDGIEKPLLCDNNGNEILLYGDNGIRGKGFFSPNITQQTNGSVPCVCDSVGNIIMYLSKLANAHSFTILGDSYSTFQGYNDPVGNLKWYPGGQDNSSNNDVTSVEQTWWWLLAKEFGMTMMQNNSYSGATICYDGYAEGTTDAKNISFCKRCENLTKADIIFIEGGTNDSWANAEIGEYKYTDISETDKETFRPALAYTIDYIIHHYIGCNIIFILNDGLKEEINKSVDTICKHYNVPVIKLQNISKTDNHPNANGMVEFENQVSAFMKGAKNE